MATERPVRAAALLAGLALAPGAHAVEWLIVPQVSASETYSDNPTLTANSAARRGWVSDVTPGLRIEHTGARSSLLVDYQLHELFYSTQSSLNTAQRYLNSFAHAEAIENWLYVDALAAITQQNRNAFGPTVLPNAPSASANRVETKVYQASPYVRSHVSDLAVYQVRFNATDIRSDDIALPPTRTYEWVGRIRNASPSAKLGWSVDGNSLKVKNDIVGSREDSRVRASLIYAVVPQLHVSLSDGRESTDFTGADKVARSTPGVGIEWAAGARTLLVAAAERRFFGTGYSAAFQHRTPQTAWRIGATRDAVVLPNLLATNNPGSIYSLMYDLFTSAIPDPVARAAAVRQRLQDTGLPNDSALGSGFITARPFIDRVIDASTAFIGINNTVTLRYLYEERKGFGVSLADSFSLSDDIRQRGFNADWAHRMSPVTTLNLLATSLRTEGLTVTSLQTTSKLATLALTTRLGPKTTTSLGYRHVWFDGGTAAISYRENAVVGTLSIRF